MTILLNTHKFGARRLSKILSKRNLSDQKLDEIKIKANILATFKQVGEKLEEAEEAEEATSGKSTFSGLIWTHLTSGLRLLTSGLFMSEVSR